MKPAQLARDPHPISTAPKDGTHILGYGRYAWGGGWAWPDFSRGKVGWAVIFWEEMEDGVYTPLPDGGYPDGEPDALGVWRLANANLYVDWMDATHWMPLPDPPKE